MLEKEFHISRLIKAHLKGGLNAMQELELNAWLELSEDNRRLFNDFNLEQEVRNKINKYESANKAAIWSKTMSRLNGHKPLKSTTPLWYKLTAAVAAVVIILSSIYFFSSNDGILEQVDYVNDVLPGKSSATLTLGNGDKISLEQAINGKIAQDSGIIITKTADGGIIYQTDKNSLKSSQEINTLSTGRGQTYMLTLPDHSKVWMNASSSLTYSMGLLQKGVRLIKLEGEAYFEVSKDKMHPFIVESNGQQVKVLGTHFNISSYAEDEATQTTLLEGSVEVRNKLNIRILKPNQQARYAAGDIQIKNVNAESFVDWKNGVFSFENESLQSIMRKVARWYDVEVVYQGTEEETQTFSGTVSKSSNVSKVLKTFNDSSDLKFKIEGRKIFISR
ncbi:FecR family protein [Pedobacter hiemivivus]|uniref:FecR family protein n=1 Tax=Pedobacter hiemivivus TaxID=2530454 RepID=A0A4R0NI60_9SPHI|nr:FecR family protein [Pedobacter hiemivivus]TCC99467.1 FecR family protein [Pedobacter hiemivivus]